MIWLTSLSNSAEQFLSSQSECRAKGQLIDKSPRKFSRNPPTSNVTTCEQQTFRLYLVYYYSDKRNEVSSRFFCINSFRKKKTLLKRKLLHFFQTFRGSILSSYEFPKLQVVSIENVTWLGCHFVNSECSVGEDQLEVGCVLPGPISDLVAEPGVLGRHQAYGPLQTIVRYLK